MGIVTCSNKDGLSVEQLLLSCFGKDANGNTYLRMVLYEPQNCNDNLDAVSCDSMPQLTLDNLIRSAVVLDVCGHAALRIGVVLPD